MIKQTIVCRLGCVAMFAWLLCLHALPASTAQVLPGSGFHAINGAYWNCTAVSAADMDGDGDVDVLSANWQGTGSIVLWKNNDGYFSADTVDAAFPGASTLYADDLDRDGDMDIVAISVHTSRFAWYENQGYLGWKRWDMSIQFLDIAAMSPVSIDRYAAPGILFDSSTPFDGISVVLVDPGKAYKGWSHVHVGIHPHEFPDVSALYPGDIDRDGDMDIVAASTYENRVYWYQYNPQTGSNIAHIVDDSFARPIWVQAADLDGDGDLDILGASDTAGLVWWQNNDGEGTLWTRHIITQQETYGPNSLHAVDLDRDGDLDLLAATRTQVLWWENLGAPRQAGNWVRREVYQRSTATAQGYALFPADLNGDGQLDVVSCDCRDLSATQDRGLGWWENQHKPPPANDLFFSGATVDTTLTGAHGIDLADFNGDGRLDVIAAGSGNGTTIQGETRIWRNVPGSSVTWSQMYSTTFGQERGVVAFSTGWAIPHFAISGGGEFGLGQVDEYMSGYWDWRSAARNTTFSLMGQVHMSVAADLNGDGRLDIISASPGSGQVVWARTEITPFMRTQLTIGTCDGARAVAVADLDNDGDLDVAAACQDEGRIIWWKNNDWGASWSEQTNLANFAGATDVQCADMDGDGKMEVVAASPGWWSIAWFNPEVTDGPVTDKMAWVTDVFTGVTYIELADLDRDGDMDVVATSEYRQELRWFENRFTTPDVCYVDCFVARVIDEAMDGVRECAVGDINGDGLPDLVAAMHNSGRVHWYAQQALAELYLDIPSGYIHTPAISTGQSLPYPLQITNNSPTPVDVRLVVSWEPPEAIAIAGGPGCGGIDSSGAMVCSLAGIPAGHIVTHQIVVTPSLYYSGNITPTVRLLPIDSFMATTSENQRTITFAPTLVQRDNSLCDLSVGVSGGPSGSVFTGGSFAYTMSIANLGPAPSGSISLHNMWTPANAIAGLSIGGLSGLSAQAANCTVDADTGIISCDIDPLDVGQEIDITVLVTTSAQFDGVLESSIQVSGANDGDPTNNQSLPFRVGSRPLFQVFVPVVVKQ